MHNKTLHIALNSLILSLLIFLLIPLNLVSSNFREFAGFSYAEYFSYATILITFSLILFLIGFLILNRISPKIASKIQTFLMGYLVICGFYLSIRSGLLDGKEVIKVDYWRFVFIFIFTLAGTIFFEKKFRLLIWIALLGGVASMLIGLKELNTTHNGSPNSKKDAQTAAFFEVSTNQKNIFLISFDGLESHRIASIIESNPDMKKAFNGFTNFTNTTAVAPFTTLSLLTTKLGYLPKINGNTSAIVKDPSKTFITDLLKKEHYQVSAYATFEYGESKGTLHIPKYRIAAKKMNFYQFSLTNAYQRYLPSIKKITANTNKALYFIKADFFNDPDEDKLSFAIATDPNNSATTKSDLIHFNYFVEHLKPTTSKSTAHFHHFVFTHNPIAYNSNCEYKHINTVKQNAKTAIQESECAVKEFVKFLDKLKSLHAFDNSLIIFASDHGNECKYSDPSSPNKYKVSKRWCLARYMPVLMIKPFGTTAPYSTNHFQASLLDISKTLCVLTTKNPSDCKIYEGVDLLNIQPNDNLVKRDILVTKPTVDFDAREYNDFDIVNIGRKEGIVAYFSRIPEAEKNNEGF